MNYQKLANLLYPNTQTSPEELEQKYKKRDLPENAYVTRFAPSPTGYMHIGNFFSAFLDSNIAKMSGGKFFFRLEDTDKKREVEGSGSVAINVLHSFGVSPDEGLQPDMSQKGKYGPYVQSQRLDIYNVYAKKLVSEGKAFPCFCEKTTGIEEIKERREKQYKASNETLEEKDVCRNLSFEEIQTKISAGKKFALRLKSEGTSEDKILAFDLIRGKRELPANTKDVILMKNNGIPPYAFAHAVDDHLMRTSVVVRGEEWFPSLPAHLEIFDSLGFDRVKYIHTASISKIDEKTGTKRKLSKRKDPEADMRYFSKEGYPKQALLEYLMTLANSNFEIWRIKNPNAPLEDFEFKIKKINTSNAMFDLVKLNDISKNIISKMTAEEVLENLLTYTKEYDEEFHEKLTSNKQYALKVLAIDRGGKKPRKDFAKYNDFKNFFDYMFGFKNLSQKENFELENLNLSDVKNVLSNYSNIYSAQDEKSDWFNKVKELGGELGFATNNKEYKENPEAFKGNIADVCNFIRVAITGKQNSPDIHTIGQILGQDEVIKRLENLNKLI